MEASPKSLSSRRASGRVSLSIFFASRRETTGPGGISAGSGSPFLRVVGATSGVPYSS